MFTKYFAVSRLLATLLILAALVMLASFPGATNANADKPSDPPTSGREAVSSVVRFDPHVYGRPAQQLPFALGAVPFITNFNTTNDPRAQNETTIDINPLTSSIRVGAENDYRTNPSGDVNCGYTHSSDGGVTWSSSYLKGVTKGNGGPFDYDAAGDPSVYYADDGTVYYACLAFDRSYARSAILVAKSTDGGANWSTPVAVAQSNSFNLFHDKEMLTIDNSSGSPFHGRLYVEWSEFINGLSSAQMVISYSKDGGATWSVPFVLSGNQGSVEGASPAVAPDGTVYASWCYGATYCDSGTAASTIFISKSTDGGVTWSAPMAADNFNSLPSSLPGNLFRINSFPTIAVNPTNGYIYLSHAAQHSNADMVFLFSADGGNTWSNPNTLQPTADDQFFQWMRVSASGILWVCYYDQHWNATNYLDMSCNGSRNGKIFSGGRRVTTLSSNPANDGFGGAFIGDYTGVAIDSVNIPHPLWTDTRTGNADAWTGNR